MSQNSVDYSVENFQRFALNLRCSNSFGYYFKDNVLTLPLYQYDNVYSDFCKIKSNMPYC